MRLSFAGVVVALAAVLPAFAQPASQAPEPSMSPGDTWVFRNVDAFTEIEAGRFTDTFVRREAVRLLFRRQSLPGGTTENVYRSFGLGRCAVAGGREVCADGFRFPLRVGGSHSYEDMPTGGGSTQDLECVVKASEKVTVPAATYDAWRVECEGRWRFASSDFIFRGRIWNTHWYAPAVQHEVRAVYRTYRQNGGLDYYRRIELVEFRPSGSPAIALPAAATPAAPVQAEFSLGSTRFSGRFSLDPGGQSYTGEGRVVWANGDVYEGSLVGGLREGQGAFVWADGQRYDGQWRKDRPDGRGRLRFVNGDLYEGELVDGQPAGEGSLDYASGARHVGTFAGGIPQGRGRLRSPGGQTVDALWRDGHAYGTASIAFANGDRYDGEIERGAPHGQGRLLYPSGDLYVGSFVAGRPDGEGTFTWKSGDRYEGAWKEGRKHGKARFTWASGDRWEGSFVDDQRSEDGVLIRR